jgi:2'-5' RNA ligase
MHFPIMYRDGRRQGFLEIDLAALAAEPSKGCLMAMCDANLADKVRLFSKNRIKDENLAEDGRESEIHATVLYGFDPEFETSPLKALLENQESICCSLGAVSRFERPDYDVLKIEVNSPEMQKLHYILKHACSDEVKFKHQLYQPHVTLAYIKKNTHRELDGHQAFVKDEFYISSLVYSPPDKTKRQVLNLKH